VLTAPSFFGTYNDYAVEALRAHRRLRGTVILDPGTEPFALRELADAGVVGLRFSLRRYPVVPDLTQPDWQRLLRGVRDLDWYVHLLAESERSAQMIPVLERAGVKLVIDHYGVPERKPLDQDPGFAAALRALSGGRTWIKLSAPYRVPVGNVGQVTQRLLAEAGTERLVWGSDCPWVAHESQFSYRDTIRWFEETVPDVAAREAIGRTGLALNKFI
jgi:predicted TIM-barrel fold metal-dependent hydrolase